MDTHKTEGGANPSPGKDSQRWIVYLSPDRRVLWTDNGDNRSDPATPSAPRNGDGLPPELRVWSDLLEAAYETRMPQAGRRRVAVDGVEKNYTLKAFPDFGIDGEFKGVIQVVESGDYRTGSALRKNITALLDLTLSGVILYDPPSDAILNVNRRAAQQTGYSLAELESTPGRRLFGEAGVALLRNIFARMARSDKTVVWGQNLAIEDRYGRRRTYFCSLRPIPRHPVPDSLPVMLVSIDDPAGPAGRLNPGFVTDALLEGLWEYDTLQRTFHYGATFADILGPEGAPGSPGKKLDDWIESIHPAETPRILRSWRALLKKGVRYEVRYRIRDPNGDWRWIFSTIHAIVNDARGRPRRVVGFHHDISEVVRVNSDLVDAEERLRTIFDNTGGGIAVAGMNGEFIQVNPALAMLLGRNRADFVGRRLEDFAHSEDAQELRAALERVTRSGRRETMADIRLLRADGDVRWVNLTVTISGKIHGGDRYVILMLDDATESHERRMRMQYEATHDVMTGAWNRWVLMERLEQHLQLARRHRGQLTFCICDLDHFKKINDRYGHQAGDRVLVEFVRLLKESVRTTDLVGRYGGEEFGVVFPQTGIERARQPIERARRLFGEAVFSGPNGERFGVSATFGLAGTDGRGTVKNLIAQADEALYEGKKAGRNRVVIFTPPLVGTAQ